MEPFREYPLVPDDPQQIVTGGTFAVGVLDREGIIMTDYRHDDIGLQYSPVSVCQYALSHYNAYLRNTGTPHLEAFQNQSRWLMDTFVDRGAWGVWHFKFDFLTPGSRCRKPWPSSMAQGLGISTLIRYHALTEDPEARDVARKALAAYDIPIRDGGILRVDSRDLTWYEEYPCPGSGTALNGFLFSLIGAREWYNHTGDPAGREKWRTGLRTLRDALGDFELRLPHMRWTRYDNRFIVHSGRRYHDLHLRQLAALRELAEEDAVGFLRAYHRRWREWQRIYGKSVLFPVYRKLGRQYAAIASKIFGEVPRS